MRKYLLVLVLMFLLLGCQKPAVETVKESPATSPQGAVVAEVERPAPPPIILMEEVEILGKEGFNPSELIIKSGDLVLWVNQDPQEKAAVLTFQKDKGRQFFNSEAIPSGGTYTHNFEEAGVYDYWTIGYGVKGKVVVE